MEEMETIKQKLIDAIISKNKLTWEGKFRLAGHQAKIIDEILDEIESGQVDKLVLDQLCLHENMNVRHILAQHMLRTNYKTDLALETLTTVANSGESLYSLVAGWQVKWWKESGTIDPPNQNKNKKAKTPKKKNRKGTLPTFEPATAKYEELNEKQRVAYLSSLYDGEVNNGGHYQYFENQGIEHAQETINSLKIIGARKQSKILEKAYNQYLSHERNHPKTAEEFVAEERKGEFSKLDDAFYDVETEIQELVDEYLEKNNL
jgi:hypothetical protein